MAQARTAARRPFWSPAAASAGWPRPMRSRTRASRCACSSRSPEFREVGAGIQLGPNIFRVLEKIGLKDAVLADAHRPPAQEMRDALTGKLITRIPLGDEFFERFGQPYAVTHRADIHGTFLKACQSSNLITLETSRRVDGFEDRGDGVTVTLENGERVEGCALIGCDGMWSKIRERIVGDGKPRVSGHIAYRAVLKREDVPDDLWRPDVVLWAGPRTHFVHYPLRRGELYNLVAVFHSDRYEEGWNAEGSKDADVAAFQGARCRRSLRMLERIETWRMWVLCDREPVKNWSRGRVTLLGDAAHPMLQYLAQGACMATEDAVVLAEKVAAKPGRPAGRVPGLRAGALSAHRAARRSWRASMASSITRAASPPNCATWRSPAARRSRATTASPGSTAGREAVRDRPSLSSECPPCR